MTQQTDRELIQRLADALEVLHKEAVTTPHNQTIVVGGVAHPIPIGSDLIARDAIYAHLLDRARARLAQPEPQGPTDEGLLKTYCDARREFYFEHAAGDSDQEDRKAAAIWGLRAVLTRWGRPAIESVPVAERPWEREGWCDADGKCWWGRPSEELCNSDWFLATRAEVEEFCDCFPPVVSLPHWELPVPTP
jgi:hypothetical protein